MKLKMIQAPTRIGKIIREIQTRELPCRVRNLPQGISCSFRAHFASEINKHEQSHSDSIIKNRKTNSRQYEIKTEDLKAIRVELGVDHSTNIDQEGSTPSSLRSAVSQEDLEVESIPISSQLSPS